MPDWPAAILFDFDGVLVHSEPLHYQAFREVAADEGIDLTEAEYFDELIGFDDRGAWRRLFERHGRRADAPTLLRVMARKIRIMRELIAQQRHRALPGVEALVRSLWRTYPLAICSGAMREEIEAMLQTVRLRDCFRTIIAAEDVARGKPDPEGYLLAADTVGRLVGKPIEPARCLVVEDAPAVIRSARGAGFRTLGVVGTCSAERLSDADHVVPSLRPAHVRAVLPELNLFDEVA